MPKTLKAARAKLQGSIARSLVEFGYPDVTAEMIADIWDAYAAGKRGGDLPHDIIGLFAERQLDEVRQARPDILGAARP